MVQSPPGGAGPNAAPVSADDFRRAYRWMLQARVLDEKFASLYRGGKITGGVYLGRGQEALSVAAVLPLRKGDIYSPLIRDGAGRLAFGEPLLDGARTYLGSALGPMRGRDGNIHRGRPRDGLLAMISHLGAMIPVVNGCLLAHRLRGVKDTVGVASIGDGGTSTGAFHEALNLAAVEKLPLVLVVADNQYAYSTPNARQFACRSLADRAIGYGVAGHTVDGTDLLACLTVLRDAVAAARAGGGPQLVVGSLLRLCGHGEHDDASYVAAQLKNSPLGRDCLALAAHELTTRQWATDAELSAWRDAAVKAAEDTVAQAQREPAPSPFTEDWCALATRQLAETHQEAQARPRMAAVA